MKRRTFLARLGQLAALPAAAAAGVLTTSKPSYWTEAELNYYMNRAVEDLVDRGRLEYFKGHQWLFWNPKLGDEGDWEAPRR